MTRLRSECKTAQMRLLAQSLNGSEVLAPDQSLPHFDSHPFVRPFQPWGDLSDELSLLFHLTAALLSEGSDQTFSQDSRPSSPAAFLASPLRHLLAVPKMRSCSSSPGLSADDKALEVM